MEPFRVHEGLVAPLERAQVDTDAIIPKQFMKTVQRSGLGPFLFDAWAHLDPGEPGMDTRQRRPNPDFVLNQPRYAGASVLLTRDNFGAGSSREHAPWALWDAGFRVLIGSGFADIFHNNCINNGLLLIALPAPQVQRLFEAVQARPGWALRVDLPAQRISAPDLPEIPFELDPFVKQRLLHGWDPVGLVLRHAEAIRAFEARHQHSSPWVFRSS